MSEIKIGKGKPIPKEEIEKTVEPMPAKPRKKKTETSFVDVPIAKKRYNDYIGKYKLNIEEFSLLKEISSIGAFFLEYSESMRSFIFLTPEGKRVTVLSSYVLPNVPRDKKYEIKEML